MPTTLPSKRRSSGTLSQSTNFTGANNSVNGEDRGGTDGASLMSSPGNLSASPASRRPAPLPWISGVGAVSPTTTNSTLNGHSPPSANGAATHLSGSIWTGPVSKLRFDLDAWSTFNIFTFSIGEDGPSTCLSRLGMALLARNGFLTATSPGHKHASSPRRNDSYLGLLSPSVLDGSNITVAPNVARNFLMALEREYRDIPYHNAIHAADVAQSLSCLLNTAVSPKRGSRLMRFAALIAAMSHDVAHVGFNNAFLVKTRHALALRYNDHSPLENMHASKLFEIMWGTPGCDVSGRLEAKHEQTLFRRFSIDFILATDNSKHDEVVQSITIAAPSPLNLALGAGRASGFPLEPGVVSSFIDDTSLFSALIHFSDLGGTSKTFKLAREWAGRITQEFYTQGDLELQLGLGPISAVLDRKSFVPIGVVQEGFLRKMVIPLCRALHAVEYVDMSQQLLASSNVAKDWVLGTKEKRPSSLKASGSFSYGRRRVSVGGVATTSAAGDSEIGVALGVSQSSTGASPSNAVPLAKSLGRFKSMNEPMTTSERLQQPPAMMHRSISGLPRRSDSEDELTELVIEEDVEKGLSASPRSFEADYPATYSGGTAFSTTKSLRPRVQQQDSFNSFASWMDEMDVQRDEIYATKSFSPRSSNLRPPIVVPAMSARRPSLNHADFDDDPSDLLASTWIDEPRLAESTYEAPARLPPTSNLTARMKILAANRARAMYFSPPSPEVLLTRDEDDEGFPGASSAFSLVGAPLREEEPGATTKAAAKAARASSTARLSGLSA